MKPGPVFRKLKSTNMRLLKQFIGQKDRVSPFVNEAVNPITGVVFVAIPKTASTMIRQQVRPPGPFWVNHPHLTILQIRELMIAHEWVTRLGTNRSFPASHLGVDTHSQLALEGERKFDSYFKFSCVRNPYDRVWSLYNRREGLQMREEMSFEEFALSVKNASDTSVRCLRVESQIDWIRGQGGEMLVDYALRFEDLAAGIANLNENVPELAKLTHNDVVKPGISRPHYTEVYSNRSRAHIAKVFREDIEFFGYSF